MLLIFQSAKNFFGNGVHLLAASVLLEVQFKSSIRCNLYPRFRRINKLFFTSPAAVGFLEVKFGARDVTKSQLPPLHAALLTFSLAAYLLEKPTIYVYDYYYSGGSSY
jgi:hypothetical protein